jgi:NADH:ubiquinone oxidoreductase subunit 4 (subunit M)
LIAGLSVILTAVYLLRVVQRWLYGKRHPSLDRLPDLGAGEIAAVVPLLLASFFFGFYPKPINDQSVPVVVQLSSEARKAAEARQASAKAKSTAKVEVTKPAAPATVPAVSAPTTTPVKP